MGQPTGAFETVFSDDVEMFRPDKLAQFDAICFNNTLAVLFDDPELKKSLLGFVGSGRIVGFHAAIATFVQYPEYDQWPSFGHMLGATENGGHPWTGVTTMKVDERRTRSTPGFTGRDSRSPMRLFSFRSRCYATTCMCF